MRKFAKPILITLAIVALLYALAILAANIYLQSTDVQNRIRVAASQAVGTTVEIGGAYYMPWSGLMVSHIKMTHPSEAKIPLLDVSSVSLHFAFFPLLRGQLVISDVLFSEPSLTSIQAASGTQHHSRLAPSTENTSPQVEIGATPVPPIVEISVPDKPLLLPASAKVPVSIEHLRIHNGKAAFYNEKGELLMALDQVGINAHLLPGNSVTGDFKIREISLLGGVRPRRMTGKFSWVNGNLDISEINAQWAGGELTGTFQWKSDPVSRFAATLAADSVSLKKLAIDAGMNGEGTKGKLFGKGEISGTAEKLETFNGHAEVFLQNARLQPLDFIRQIGELAQIEELQMLQLKTAEASLTIRDEKVFADKIVLESENLIMDATGPTGFDGKLKLQARLHINEKLRNNFHGLIGKNFQASDREGYYQMPFSVTGSISRPKTDLLDKLIGMKIGQDMGGLFKNLFRQPPAKKTNDSDAAATDAVR